MELPRRNLRIVCDGTPFNVRIEDADTGEDLRMPVMSLAWRVSSNNLAKCFIEIDHVAADVVGEAGQSWSDFTDRLAKVLSDGHEDR